MSYRQDIAAGLVLIGLHPFPQIARVVAAEGAHGNEWFDLARLVAIVAENHVSVEVVAAGVRRPLIADERGEMARIIGFLGGFDSVLPGALVGKRSRERQKRLRKSPLRECNNHFDCRVCALPPLDHVIPFPAGRIRQHRRLTAEQIWKEPHIVGVIRYNQEVERPRQLGWLSRRSRDLLALGKAVSVARTQAGAEGTGVKGIHSVKMGIAE